MAAKAPGAGETAPKSTEQPEPGARLPPDSDAGVDEALDSEELRSSLLSLEKLDRASPDLWPEQIPGVSEFAPLQPAQSPPAWSRGLAPDDINYMHQLGTLTTSGLIIEVKKLHDLAYQLGLEEVKEMTRGKYLNIFTSRRPR